MENVIIQASRLDPQNLDSDDYLLSLLEESFLAGLISEAGLQNLQAQVMEVLKDLIIRYTSGESSSVPVETAQNLLMSALFCLDTICMSFPVPEDCLFELQKTGVKAVYRKGLDLVRSKVRETENLFNDVKSSKIRTPLVAYNFTIDEAIPGFFTHYDPAFNAHDATVTIDYPLACDDPRARGVLYMRQYLEKLKLENQFCRRFAPEGIEHLLENYSKIYRIYYPEFLLNIFEIVLTNSVMAFVLGGDPRSLDIHESQYHLLRAKFKGLDTGEVTAVLNTALDQLISELGITDPQMAAYIHLCENGLAARLINALRQDSLKQFAIPVVIDEPQPEILVEMGEAMDDEAFRSLVEAALGCADASEKAGLILSRVGSLLDFTDILKADCLFGDEYLVLFELLGDMEISVLARIVFFDELRENPGSFSLSKALAGISASETEWISRLLEFLPLLDKERLKIIESLVNTETGIDI